MSLIESQDLLGFLPRETIPPPQYLEQDGKQIDNPDYASLIRTDRLVKYWVIGTLSEDVLGHAVGLKTAAQVWKALTKH